MREKESARRWEVLEISSIHGRTVVPTRSSLAETLVQNGTAGEMAAGGGMAPSAIQGSLLGCNVSDAQLSSEYGVRRGAGAGAGAVAGNDDLR